MILATPVQIVVTCDRCHDVDHYAPNIDAIDAARAARRIGWHVIGKAFDHFECRCPDCAPKGSA